MTITINAGPEEVLLPIGKHHVQITGVRHRIEDKSPNLELEYKVLAGPDGSPIGAVAHEKFFLTQNSERRLRILLERVGMIPPKDPRTELTFEEQDLVGLHLIADIVHDPYTNQKTQEVIQRSKWAFAGFWRVDDPRPELRDAPRAPGYGPPNAPNGESLFAAGTNEDF